jgi:tetratricopeptide (TPR) repeat protein
MIGKKGLRVSEALTAIILLISVLIIPLRQAASEECDNLYNAGQYEASALCYLSLSPPNYWGAAVGYCWAGITAYNQGDYETAIIFYQKEINYFSLTSDKKSLGEAYYHAGTAYYSLKNYVDAEKYFLLGGGLSAQCLDFWRAGVSYCWAGISAYDRGDYQAALSHYLEEIKYMDLASDLKSLGGAYYHAGTAAYKLVQLAEARDYFFIGGAKSAEAQDYERAGISYEWAGNVASQEKDYSAAADYFALSGENWAKNANYSKAGEVYNRAGNMAQKVGDCPKAIEYWTLAKENYSRAGVDYTIPPCNPVILIHGWRRDKPANEIWDPLIARLKAAGYADNAIFVFDYGSGVERPAVYAQRLQDAIEAARSTYTHRFTGKFDIVCHSYGAMVSRWYMKELQGWPNIRQWIGLAPVNHGAAVVDQPIQSIAWWLNNFLFFLPGYITGSEPAIDAMKTKSPELSRLNYNLSNFDVATWKTAPEILPTSVIYRTIVGLGYTTESVNKDKNGLYYYKTDRGDGVVPLLQSQLQEVGIDCLFGADHNGILGDSRAHDLVVSYLKYPYIASLNNLPTTPDPKDKRPSGKIGASMHLLLGNSW